MNYILGLPQSFRKKHALKLPDFVSGADQLQIDVSEFSVVQPSFVVASKKKKFRSALKTDATFIYRRKKGLLYFNANGSAEGFGDGGIVAVLPRKARLGSDQLLFQTGSASAGVVDVASVFEGGPRPLERTTQLFSGAIGAAGERDRYPFSTTVGDVVTLSVEAADGTWPLVRLLDAQGQTLAEASAYNATSASTSGLRSPGGELTAEVHAQHSFTGSYALEVEAQVGGKPRAAIPQELSILLDEEALQQSDHYAARYLYSDDGLMGVSFGSGVDAELQGWWEDVLAAADALIEPEFVVLPLGHPRSQLVLKQTSATSVNGAAGHYQGPGNTYSLLEDGGHYNYRRSTPAGEILLAESAFTHASRFAGSREAGWKSTAFHELGHALGLEHPHDGSDGDVDPLIDTNGTVMSYVKEQDLDGDPGFTQLDVQAIQFVYGAESGALAASDLDGIPLLIESRAFDLDQRWKAPRLSAQWLGGPQVREPSSGLKTKTLKLTRSDGDVSQASRIWLDFDLGPDLMNWNSRSGFSEGFHDVLILANSVTFQPGEESVLFDLPIVAGDHAEAEEWLDVVVRPEYPGHYSAVPDGALRLSILDA